MNNKTGGSAFPEVISDKDNNGRYDTYSYGGMSLRDYFAGQVLGSFGSIEMKAKIMPWAAIARFCYEIADTMLAEREKNKETT